MTHGQFAAAVIVLIEDKGAVHRASMRDLCVLQGVLTTLLSEVEAELERRDWTFAARERGRWYRARLRIRAYFMD